MSQIYVRNYIPEDITQVIQVQEEYKKKYPSYSIRGEDIYTHHPGFENGKNIFCAFDENGILLAYSAIITATVNDDAIDAFYHHIWTDIINNPTFNGIDIVKEKLFEQIIKRVIEIKTTLAKRPVRLSVLKGSDERDEFDFFTAKGFQNYETVYMMDRDLSMPIFNIPAPSKLTIKRWKIESPDDKAKYIKADNISNPHNPMTHEKLEWGLEKIWSSGLSIAAFDDSGELIGSVMAYWFDDLSGITEEIFVIPRWRRKGIAQYLIKEALQFLKECGKKQASLEVKKSNDSAVSLYKKMGYEIGIVEYSFGLII